MAAQDACVPLSFWLILSAILIDGDGQESFGIFCRVDPEFIGLAANRLAVWSCSSCSDDSSQTILACGRVRLA
jgi:hypothetical protein